MGRCEMTVKELVKAYPKYSIALAIVVVLAIASIWGVNP
jgi:hypothetical protein